MSSAAQKLKEENISAMPKPCIPDPDVELEEKLKRLTMVKHPSLNQGKIV